jgi:chromosome segregation ATPase
MKALIVICVLETLGLVALGISYSKSNQEHQRIYDGLWDKLSESCDAHRNTRTELNAALTEVKELRSHQPDMAAWLAKVDALERKALASANSLYYVQQDADRYARYAQSLEQANGQLRTDLANLRAGLSQQQTAGAAQLRQLIAQLSQLQADADARADRAYYDGVLDARAAQKPRLPELEFPQWIYMEVRHRHD